MDMNFRLQSLMSEYLVEIKDLLKPGIIEFPPEINDKGAFLKLESMGIEIDKLIEGKYKFIISSHFFDLPKFYLSNINYLNLIDCYNFVKI